MKINLTERKMKRKNRDWPTPNSSARDNHRVSSEIGTLLALNNSDAKVKNVTETATWERNLNDKSTNNINGKMLTLLISSRAGHLYKSAPR